MNLNGAWISAFIEGAKHLAAKIVTAFGTYFVANDGLQVMWNYVLGETPALEVKLLLLASGYAVWTNAIIPVVEALFEDLKRTMYGGRVVKTASPARTGAEYFKLI